MISSTSCDDSSVASMSHSLSIVDAIHQLLVSDVFSQSFSDVLSVSCWVFVFEPLNVSGIKVQCYLGDGLQDYPHLCAPAIFHLPFPEESLRLYQDRGSW